MFTKTPKETQKRLDDYTTTTSGLESLKSNRTPSKSGQHQESAAEQQTFSSDETNVHTRVPEPTHLAEQSAKLKDKIEVPGRMSSLGAVGEESMLATQPLLRKTGGRDIYDHRSLENLYINQANSSIEFLGKEIKDVK
jgi:hypothetical protein